MCAVSVTELLGRLFEALARQSLPYAVLRNYEGLPQEKSGNDIDLIVQPQEIDRHLRVAIRTVQESGWKTVQIVVRPYVASVKFAATQTYGGAWPEVLHFDYFTVGSWYGAVFMEADPVLRRRRSYGPRGISVVHPVDELLHIIVHHMLWSGVVRKSKYRAALAALALDDHNELERNLTRLFGSRWCKRLLEAVVDGRTLTRQEQWTVRLQLICRRRSRLVSRDMRLWTGMLAAEIRQGLYPPGAVVWLRYANGAQRDRRLREIVAWLRRLGQFNHGLLWHPPPELICDDEVVLRRLRRHYRGSHGPSSRALRVALDRGRRRGWIVCCVASESAYMLARSADIVLTDSAVPPHWWAKDSKPIVSINESEELSQVGVELVRLLNQRCAARWYKLLRDAQTW